MSPRARTCIRASSFARYEVRPLATGVVLLVLATATPGRMTFVLAWAAVGIGCTFPALSVATLKKA
jgi:hypothetical protein